MNNENLWGDDVFNDMPEEGLTPDLPQMPEYSTKQTLVDSTNQVVEEPVVTEPEEQEQIDVSQIEEEEDFSEVLNDANLRLEQGNLYKLIMNHDLFSGIEADPRALRNVQKEIRKFAKERMEIMLGMKKETETIENIKIDFPFNSLEIEVLKKLASTATKGASENSEKYTAEVVKVKEQATVKKNKLNSITNASRPKQTISQVSVSQSKSNLKTKPSTPIKRSKLDLTIDQIAQEENIPRELLEEGLPGLGGKPVNEMTEQEILERNRIVSRRRQPRVKSKKALPMATYEQQEMLALTQAGQIQTSPLMIKILEAVKNMPTKQ